MKSPSPIFDIVKRAYDYPLHYRVAARIIKEGHNQVSFRKMIKNNIQWKTLPEPILVAIENAIRDIENGFIKVDSDLHKLTNNL
jgi:hypothetical protein